MTLVSLILCTRNRCSLLQPALNSISRAAQAVPELKLEVIVVDNGSSDNTPGILAEILIDYPLTLILKNEPLAGVSRAKNKGFSASSGDIIVFMDDDCILSASYFIDLMAHFSGDTEPVVRGGRVQLGNKEDLPFTVKTDPEPTSFAPPQHPGGFIHGCNLAMNRSVFAAIGGFDERFGPGAVFIAAEDTEIVYRAHKASIPVRYVPDMATFHFHGRSSESDINRLHYQYEFGNGALAAKYRLRDGLLMRHLYWNLRNTVRELLGGPKFNRELNISHASSAIANLAGIMRYYLHRVIGR